MCFCGGFSLDRLPPRLNLSSRGMDIPAISCPSCNANVESANHVFFECDIATDMWKLVFRWCGIPLFQASSWDSFNDWIISWHASKEKKHRAAFGFFLKLAFKFAGLGLLLRKVENIGQVSTGPSLPTVVDLMMDKDKLSSLEDTTIPESFPPLSTPVTTVDNAPGKSSYANIIGKPSGKKVNVCTLFTPGGNKIDVVVPVDSIRAISERFANTAYVFFLGKKMAYPVVANYVRNTWDDMLENGPWFIRNNSRILKKWHPDENLLKEDVSTVPSWGRSSYARVMIELRADVELKDNIVVVMPKITREGHYTCVGEKKTVKKHSQTSRGVPVGQKIGFKHQKEYRHVPKKPNASSSGNKKKGVEPTLEVNNEATSSGSSFMHIYNDGEFAINTPIGEKIDKIERKIYKGKIRLLDNDGNLIVPTGIVESNSEVEVVFDETANLRISTSGKDGSDKGYDTNSLWEQWRDSYPDNDDYDRYDDDMYRNHDLSEHL
ncbi:cytokinin dehydrogenase 3-like protein [Tanacetum coccineum]